MHELLAARRTRASSRHPHSIASLTPSSIRNSPKSTSRTRPRDRAGSSGPLAGSSRRPPARGLVVVPVETSPSARVAEDKLLQSETHLLASQRIASIGSWEMDILSDQDPESSPIRWSAECHRLCSDRTDANDREMSITGVPSACRIPDDSRERCGRPVNRSLYEGIPYSIEAPDSASRMVTNGSCNSRPSGRHRSCRTGVPCEVHRYHSGHHQPGPLESSCVNRRRSRRHGRPARGGSRARFQHMLSRCINGYCETCC
jgi:hypothetical protein